MRLFSLLVAAAITIAQAKPLTPRAGVTIGSSSLSISCGSVNVDWYFPTKAPTGTIWLQHGFSRSPSNLKDLATKYATAGFLVFLPALKSLGGCAVNTAGAYNNIADLFGDWIAGDGVLLASMKSAATSAGVAAPAPPTEFLFSGHSAGGAGVTVAAAEIINKVTLAASHFHGLVLLDPVEFISGDMANALKNLASTRIQTISSPGYICNSQASGTTALESKHTGFLGVELKSGCHCDAEGSSTDWLCTLACGSPQSKNVAALQALAVAWVQDHFTGNTTTSYYPGGTYYDNLISTGVTITLSA